MAGASLLEIASEIGVTVLSAENVTMNANPTVAAAGNEPAVAGTAHLELALNTVSKPIEGVTGVYV